VVGILFQDRLHFFPGLVELPAQKIKGGQLELGVRILGIQLGHHGVGLECALGVSQLQVGLTQAGVGFQGVRIDLDGVFKLQLRAFEFAFLDVGLPLFDEFRLFFRVGLAGKYRREKEHRHQT